MRKTLMILALGATTLLGVGAKAAPLAGPIPTFAAPQVQTVEWGDWRYREWRRHRAWEHARRHEAWERWHRHEARERAHSYYGYRW